MPAHPATQAREAYHRGDYPAAEKLFRALCDREPKDPVHRLDLATLFITLIRHEEAAAELEAAAPLASQNPDLIRQVAACYFSMYRAEDACRLLAPAASAGHLPSVLGMVQILEREGRLKEAAALLEESLARHPAHPELRLLQAQLLEREGRSEEAERAARALLGAGPPVLISAKAGYQLARILDHTGRYSEAADVLATLKRSITSLPNVSRLHKEFRTRLALARELVAACPPGLPDAWRRDVSEHPLSFRPALLCGHPRSGTTVLETQLERLTNVVSFDESGAFDGGALSSAGLVGRIQVLRAMRPGGRAHVQAARHHYARSIASLHRRPIMGSPIIVDKNPTQLLQLPLWLRILPEVRFLVALRDPRDVVVSSYFFDLPPNFISLQFLDWESTARHYAALMDLWRRQRDTLPADCWLESRYEDMVAGAQGETARIARFLGLTTEEKSDPHPSAAVHSPNYATATATVHGRSVGRWPHYEEYLRSSAAVLAPFLREFGYA
jgi:tetratricopeptide (TPR) repeat protein